MTDGRENNGGARAGAGRKTKAAEDDLRERLLRACCADDMDLLEEVFAQLAKDAARSPSFKTRHESRKLLLAYIYGTPAARANAGAESDEPLTFEETVKRVITLVDRARTRRAGKADTS